jgi:3-methyladenine DNA glycosylase AlkD
VALRLALPACAPVADVRADGVAARSKATTTAGEAGLASTLAWLKKNGSRPVRDGMARYGIPDARAFGVSVGALKAHAKQLGKNHALALELWSSGWYEARMLAAFVADPAQLVVRDMNAWAKGFDSWAVCDTVCFHAFDRSPLAWGRIAPWAAAAAEFHKRAAFALLWGLSVHDRAAPDQAFIDCFPLIESAASDERDYVKKGVDMALRAIGKRSTPLHAAALELGARLRDTGAGPAAWIGRSVQRDLATARPRAARPAARAAPAGESAAAARANATPARANATPARANAAPARAAKTPARAGTAARPRAKSSKTATPARARQR